MIRKRLAMLVSCVLLTAAVASVVHADGEQDRTLVAGKQRFMEDCAVCHGESGKGQGIVASHLNNMPADLTQLTKKNDGHFPFQMIYDTIDGRANIGAHGSREMPIWGAEYKLGVPIAAGMGEAVVRGKILELIVYINSIQEN